MQQSVRTAIPGRTAVQPAERGATARGRGAAPDWMVIAPAVVTLAVMLWGITAPAYWAGEAGTGAAGARSPPPLGPLVGHGDGGPGAYYPLVWAVVPVAGARRFSAPARSAC